VQKVKMLLNEQPDQLVGRFVYQAGYEWKWQAACSSKSFAGWRTRRENPLRASDAIFPHFPRSASLIFNLFDSLADAPAVNAKSIQKNVGWQSKMV